MRERTIFISYRRGDTAGHAGRLMDGLTARFGENSVFMDLDSIGPGVNYEERIHQELGSCAVALVLIGDEWLTVTNPEGGRRIEDETDWVRLEVAEALKRDDVTLVPVLVEGARMPAAAELPEDLRRLASINAIEISDQRWRYDVERLAAVVRQSVGGGGAAARARVSGLPTAVKAGGLAALVVAATIAVLALAGVFGDSSSPAPAPQPAPAGTVKRDFAAVTRVYNVGLRTFRTRFAQDRAAQNLSAVKSDAAQFRDVMFNFDAEFRKIRFPEALLTDVYAVQEANRTSVADLDAMGDAPDFAELGRVYDTRFIPDNASFNVALRKLSLELR